MQNQEPKRHKYAGLKGIGHRYLLRKFVDPGVCRTLRAAIRHSRPFLGNKKSACTRQPDFIAGLGGGCQNLFKWRNPWSSYL